MKKSLRALQAARSTGTPITWLTCYDYSFARALNDTALDMILVGDSGGMVALGYADTTPVTMDEMVSMTASVRRGAPDKYIVGDMPKGSYEGSDQEAISNAMRFAKEAGADAVKLEGGTTMSNRIAAISAAGITVFGHIGLTPQSAAALGGYRVVGRDGQERQRVLDDAQAVQKAGASAVLLEALPPSLAGQVVESSEILVFGIGAGPLVDGQLLILHDLIGLYPDFRPKFAKCFVPDVVGAFVTSLGELDREGQDSRVMRRDGLLELTRLAVEEYVAETRSGAFPGSEYSYAE